MRAVLRVCGAPVLLAFAVAGCGTGHVRPQSRAATPEVRAAVPGEVVDARLVRAGTGWLLTDRALSWTADGGRTWTPITPPGVRARSVKGVFFLDPRHGWVVWAKPAPASRARLEISATTDGGISWSTSPLAAPGPLFADTAAEPAYIDFTDPRHGWVAVDVTQTALSPAGVLFRTTDGGARWQQLPTPTSGPVAFTGPQTGWLVCDGQPGTRPAEQFYVTTDGGQAWHAKTVIPPAG